MQTRQGRIHDEQVIGNIKYVDDTDTTLKPNEHVVEVDSGDGTVTITLPPVAECQGKFYTITAPVGNAGNTVTVETQGDEVYGTDGTNAISSGLDLVIDDAVLVVFSDGFNWIPMMVNIA